MRKTFSTERELATHSAEIKHLQADMDKLVEDIDLKSTRLNSSHMSESRMPSSA